MSNNPSMSLDSEIAFWQYRAMIRKTPEERRLCQQRADGLRRRREGKSPCPTSTAQLPAQENKSTNGSTDPKENLSERR